MARSMAIHRYAVLFFAGYLLSAECAPKNISEILGPLRKEYQLPALAAAVVKDNQLVAVGAVGYRKSGCPKRVSVDDKFHIGSCTKAMTATLAAILVEQGKLSWDMTVADAFPELKESMQKDYQLVTIEQLLAHRGGVPAHLDRDNLWSRIWQKSESLTPTQQRLFLLEEVVKHKPEATPGERFIYSNAGYAIAGAMMEKVTGESWESLMKRHIFTPLGMTSAGFGPPAKPGQIDQPWGHVLENGKPKPIPPGPQADNPPAIGPAGTVHCSISDLARWAAFHLNGIKGNEKLLSKASFRKLHTPVSGQAYALGWVVTRRDWGNGTVLTHNGSNKMFFAVMWLAPNKDFAVVAACNIGGKKAETACDQAVWQLIQKYLPQKK